MIITELPRLRRFALSLTGNCADADDLVQSSVEKLLQKGIKKNTPTTAWFLKVCKNLWIDEVRSAQKRSKLNQSASPIEPNSEAPESDQLQQIFNAMDELSDDQRQLVSLVIVEGYSYAQATQMLDIPISTVMNRVSSARAKLAELIQ